ncbi:MAG TPA: outer membrane protein assembly factor BamD [Tepidisphaeraceae bacterium]|jgi:outer membrane protein assembly factor BamD (BamD/ComL family)|nr:outer membrane protein assembly factor BamD [Tepidisphaeraceae bacterium]
MGSLRIAAVAVALVLGLASLVQAGSIIPQLSEFKDGRWQVAEGPATQPAAYQSDPQLDATEDMISAGRNKEAISRLIDYLKYNRSSPVRDRALYLMGEAQYRYGDRIKAFYYLDELLDTFPASDLYYPALSKQYDIADSFLNGYKRRVFGFVKISAEEEGVEMLFRVQQRSPGSELAEKSLLRTADYYYADSQFDLAADAYAVYIHSYSRSPLISRVKLRQAYSNLAQFRGLKFDPTPVIDARAQLLALTADFPDVAQQENIPALLDRIDATFAKKLYVTAAFYVRTHERRAAAYIYSYLVSAYPDSPEAAKAKTELLHLPSPLIEPAAPTTSPVAGAF